MFLFSVQVMALGSTNREVNMTAGEMLFLEGASCIINSQKTSTKFFVVFELAFLLGTHKPSSESHSSSVYSTYRKHSRITFNRPCTEQHSTYIQ